MSEEEEEEIINLGKENFAVFLEILTVLCKTNRDLIIKKGRICQQTDKNSSIYSLDVSSLIGDNDILMSLIANKVELLTPFQNNEVDVDLVLDDKKYTFKDSYSKLEITKPKEMYLSNKYISESDLTQKTKLDESELIFHYTLPKMLISRLIAFSKGLQATLLEFEFKKNKVVLKISGNDNTHPTTGKIVTIENEMVKELTGSCHYAIEPFLYGTEDIEIECYQNPDPKLIMLRLTTSIAGVKTVIWCLSMLNKDDE